MSVTTGGSFILGYGAGGSNAPGTFNLYNGTFTDLGSVNNIGQSATGTFNQTGGFSNFSGGVNIAQNTGSTGTFTLSGGTANVTGGLYVGGSSSGSGGTGFLSISGTGAPERHRPGRDF